VPCVFLIFLQSSIFPHGELYCIFTFCCIRIYQSFRGPSRSMTTSLCVGSPSMLRSTPYTAKSPRCGSGMPDKKVLLPPSSLVIIVERALSRAFRSSVMLRFSDIRKECEKKRNQPQARNSEKHNECCSIHTHTLDSRRCQIHGHGTQ
jgi:hypothetical protein